MSSILKALRKLETEKSELGEGSVDLARDILKRSYDERRSSPVWLITAVVAAVVMLAVGWWMSTHEQLPQQAIIPLEKPIEPAASTLPAVLEKKPVRLQPVVVMPNRVVEQTSAPLPKPAKTAALNSSPKKIAETAALIIPDLTIEEIVYVAEPSARLAVINELPVMQGTDIDGARVVEILPDRVRFEYKGVRFEKFKNPDL